MRCIIVTIVQLLVFRMSITALVIIRSSHNGLRGFAARSAVLRPFVLAHDRSHGPETSSVRTTENPFETSITWESGVCAVCKWVL